jgi:hypothetical protein
MGTRVESIDGTEEHRAQLDRWMNERRKELRAKWVEVARRAGMSPQHLVRIRKGRVAISWDAADGIERALRWERGSVEAAVLHGREPVNRTDAEEKMDETRGDDRPIADRPVIEDHRKEPAPLTAEDAALYHYLRESLAAHGLELTKENFLIMKRLGKRMAVEKEPVSPDHGR